MGWVERLGDIIIFLTLSLLPLKVSPNPTTKSNPSSQFLKLQNPALFVS